MSLWKEHSPHCPHNARYLTEIRKIQFQMPILGLHDIIHADAWKSGLLRIEFLWSASWILSFCIKSGVCETKLYWNITQLDCREINGMEHHAWFGAVDHIFHGRYYGKCRQTFPSCFLQVVSKAGWLFRALRKERQSSRRESWSCRSPSGVVLKQRSQTRKIQLCSFTFKISR